MIITLQRKKPKAPGYPVLGRLMVANRDYATLEDPYILDWRGSSEKDINWPFTKVKIPGVTAIPEGRYRIYLTMSPRFKRVLPLLIDVPWFTGIRMHQGASAEHTEGCIVVGKTHLNDRLVNEGAWAEQEIINILEANHSDGEIWIEIKNPIDL